jgi:hypothetical protein
MDDPLLVRQHGAKLGAGLRCAFCFEARNELEAAGLDANMLHDQLPEDQRLAEIETHRADGLNILQRICHGEDAGARTNGRGARRSLASGRFVTQVIQWPLRLIRNIRAI